MNTCLSLDREAPAPESQRPVTIDVRNRATGQVITYSAPGLTPRRAVELAWRQAQGDYNTWDYDRRDPAPIEEGAQVVTCGDWYALK